MIDRTHKLPITRQAELLNVSRGSVYYLPKPVSAADLMRFLFAWQHVKPGLQLHGRDGLGQIIEQLEGFELAAAGWEREILPGRVARYEAAWLDELCLSGDAAWARLSARKSNGNGTNGASAATSATPISLPGG